MNIKKSAHTLSFLLAVAVALQAPVIRAQDIDDLESELDEMATGIPPAPSATPAPAKSQSEVDPMADDMGDLELDPDDMEPTEKIAPAPKPIPKTVPKTAPEPEPEAPVVAEEPAPAPPSLAPASDEPNSSFESRLASIYSQHSQPVSDEQWSGLLGERAAESYSVQAGDTLWDLSQTLFADGFYWSKLWAENPEIQNPHNISKGQAIRFIGGTEISAPEVRVVKDEPDQLTHVAEEMFEKEEEVPAVQEVKEEELVDIDSQLDVKTIAKKPMRSSGSSPVYLEDLKGKISQADLDAGAVLEQSEIIPRPVIPPPTEVSRKVRDLPKSFQEYRPNAFRRTVTVRRRQAAAEKIPAAMVPSYLALESRPDTVGDIVEIEHGANVATIGQYVFIRGNEAIVPGSEVYSLVSRYDVTSREKRKLGEAYEVGGVLKILEKVDEQENLFRAQVIYLVNPVRVGSLVVPGDMPRVPVSTKGRRSPVESILVGGSDSAARTYFGDGATVFLETDGETRVGDVLPVQSRRGEKRESIAPNLMSPIGILKVVSVSGKIATAIVVLAIEEMRLGDRTGGAFPERLPDLRVQAPRAQTITE